MNRSKVMTVTVAEIVQKFAQIDQASWLDQGEMVFQVSRLSADEQKQFQQALNIFQSKFRKFRQIGAAAPRLRPLLGRLPKRWTTGYLLATLSENELAKVATSGKLGPTMTVRMLENTLGRSFAMAKARQYPTVSITLMNTDDAKRVLSELTAMKTRYDLIVTPSTGYRSLVKPNDPAGYQHAA